MTITAIENNITIRRAYAVPARNFRIALGKNTKIMGIVNATPDSFSQDGCLANQKDGIRKAIECAENHIHNGADIIDIGGESSRPGSKRISAAEEINRVIPIVKNVATKTDRPVSVDTTKSTVAMEALDAGASIINNIKGINSEKGLLKMVARYDAAIVLMHMKGTPRTMQEKTGYDNLIGDIIMSLRNSIENCLELGINLDKIIVDPGIGFGKSVCDNLNIINRLRDFSVLNRPILIGTSRKSFIGETINKNVLSRTYGTAATVTASIMNGAHIVRVHDTNEIKDVVDMTDAIVNSKLNYSEIN